MAQRCPTNLYYYTQEQYEQQLNLMGMLWYGSNNVWLREKFLGWRCRMGDGPVPILFDVLTKTEER